MCGVAQVVFRILVSLSIEGRAIKCLNLVYLPFRSENNERPTRVGRYWIQARDQFGLYGDNQNIEKKYIKNEKQ